MLEGYLGRETFRDGIRRYMRRHARGNAVAADLWRALGEASGEPVLELAEAWIDSPGFPLVSVARQGATVRLSQRRFFSRPGQADGAARWPVPLVLRYGLAGQVRERRLVLRDAAAEVTLEGPPDWLVANAGATGFYRVAPDAPLLDGLARHLDRLAPSERVGLLADQWALVRCGEAAIDGWLGLALAFSGETDHAVLDELVGRLGAIDHRLVAAEDRPRLAALVRERFGAAWRGAGWEAAPGEADVDRLRRAALLRAVGLVGREPAAVAEAAARLERFADGDRGALGAEPGRRGGDAGGPRRGRRALPAVPGPLRARGGAGLAAPLAARPDRLRGSGAGGAGAGRSCFGDGVPLQDWASFAAGLLANPAGRAATWARLRAEWPAVTARLANAPMLWRRVVEACGLLTTRAELEEARAFFAVQPIEPVKAAVTQTLERLAEDVELAERSRPALARWLAGRRPA